MIKHYAALGDHTVLGFVQRDLVRLQPVDAVTHIHITGVDEDSFTLLSFDGLLIRIHYDVAVATLGIEARFEFL